MYRNFLLIVISAIVVCSVVLTCSSAIAEEENNQDVPEKEVKDEKDELEELRKIPEIELSLNLSSIFLDPHSNADNTMSLARFSLKGVDVLLNKSSYENLLTRAVKMLAIDYTLAYFFISYNHELGHVFRAEQQGIPSEICMYVRNKLIGLNDDKMPFTSVKFPKKYPGPVIPIDDYYFDTLLISMGGIEADIIKNNRLAEEMMMSENQDYYEAFMYLVGKAIHIDAFINGNYPDVSDGVSQSEEDRWGGEDIFEYMVAIDYFDVRVSPSNITSGGLWNFLDSFLAMSFLHNLMHFGEGVRQVPMPKYMVATNYILAPYGPEVALSFYYRNKKKIVTKVYARKSIGQSYGFGFKILNIPFKTGISNKLNLGCDFWRQDFPDKLEKYEGSGIGISIEAEKEIGKNTSVSLGIRAKTKGYSLGCALGESISIYFGLSKRW